MKDKTLEDILKEFINDCTTSHPGDSGPGGNTPQEPVYELACYPEDVEFYIKQSFQAGYNHALEEVEKSAELWFSSYDRSNSSFDSEDFIKFITGGHCDEATAQN